MNRRHSLSQSLSAAGVALLAPRLSSTAQSPDSAPSIPHVDFRDRTRTIKDSGFWYGRVAAANRLDV